MTGLNQDNYLKKELSGKRDKMNGLYLCGGPKTRYSFLEEIIYQWSQAGYSFFGERIKMQRPNECSKTSMESHD